MGKCFLCNSDATKAVDSENHLRYYVTCPRCGFYWVEMLVETMSKGGWLNEKDKKLLSGYIRNNSGREHPFTIDKDILSSMSDMVRPYRNMPIDEKINLILQYIAKNTDSIGKPINLAEDYFQFYLTEEGELTTILDWMKQGDLLKQYGGNTFSVILTMNGWRRYENMKYDNINSKKVFIAMSFDEDLNDVFFKAIEPACSNCGFKAMRIDYVEHNEQICDKIIAEIKESRFLIADFTQQKHGVYFEAGYAQGLGMEVIKSCREDDKSNVHFDTRQYNHIFWKDLEDLKKKLVNRIKATIK